MTKTSETIVFFGSGPVAAASLRALADNFPIEAVITKPRPAHHKGDVPVLTLAEERQLKVHTVDSKQALDALLDMQPFESRVAVLVDFGIIVSQKVIDSFDLGIINSHFSLLPEWRGADPITFAILSGQQRTGVSLMLLVAAMDEGPLLGQWEYDIPADATTPSLTDALVALSSQALQETLPRYLLGSLKPKAQLEATIATSQQPTYSRRLTKEDGLIDWSKPAQQLEREVRAFLGWPKSYTQFGNIGAIITQAHVVPTQGKPGEYARNKQELIVYCGKDALAIDHLKPAGKVEMTGQAFMNGYRDLLQD